MKERSTRNLELKVRSDPEGITDVRSRLAKAGLSDMRRPRQTDTYYRVSKGRLKLRRIEELTGNSLNSDGGRSAELIGYNRPLESGSRWSRYVVAEVEIDAADRLHEALALTHDVVITVHKVREIVIWAATRIHLDVVDGLGAFIELETVVTDQDDATAAAEHRMVIERLGLDRWPAVAGSYSDLEAG